MFGTEIWARVKGGEISSMWHPCTVLLGDLLISHVVCTSLQNMISTLHPFINNWSHVTNLLKG
jgi:hypothetical protein